MYIGNEHITVGGVETATTVNDFWRWAFSDVSKRENRKAFADFLVSSSLESSKARRVQCGQPDIIWPQRDSGIRINIKAGAYTDALEPEHPDHIQIRLSEHDRPDSCDAIVFCIFRAMTPAESPLDMELWDFYTVGSKVLYRDIPDRMVITLPGLMRLEPVWSDFYGIGMAIQKAMTAT